MAGPGKGYVSKSDPRRKEWAGLQGTKAGGSNRKASASSYNPTYDPGSGTVASPSGSGRVSTSPKRSKGPRARRNPIATPEVESAVERLRSRYTDTGRTVEEARRQTEANVRQRESRVDDIAAAQVQFNEGMSRIDSIGKQNQARQNTALSSDGKTVKKFRGKRIVGTPSTKSVAEAAREGSLRGKNRLTTPEVRQTKRQVRKARRQVRRARAQVARGGMPANVPAEYAKWIRKYSPRIDRQARATYGISGNEFMAKMLQGESGFDMSKVGPDTPYGNARGAAQFIPPTRDAFVEKFGIDPWRSTKEAVQAMALHLDGKSYSKTFGIQGYNPGINDSYYLNQDVGPITQAAPRAKQRLQAARSRAASVAEKAAGLGLSVQGLVTPEQVRAMGIKPTKNLKRPTLWAQPKKARGKASLEWLNGTTPDGINPDIIRLAATISKMTGQNIQITSALRPTDYDSNHSEGGALDIAAMADGGAGEAAGDAIARAAVLAAGGTREQAEALATGAVGILQFTSPNGHSLEFLWKGDPGHRDHVHIAVEGGMARGKRVFRGRRAVGKGVLTGPTDSYMGGGSGTTTTTGGGVASGPAGSTRGQSTILDALRRPGVAAQLRSMGFRVTRDGVFRTDGESLSQTEFEKVKERMGIK